MPTPSRTLKTLEYDKVIDRLARQCSTDRGRALALALEPSHDYTEVLRRQRLTAEARRLLELKPNFSLQGVSDIAGMIQQASLDRVLEPAELLPVQATLETAKVVRETIDKLSPYIPLTADIAGLIADFRDISGAIGKTVDARGDILDSASPVLASLRRESRVVHDRLRSRLESIVSSRSGALQEPIVTLRDGRYVIPVKAELRANLPGIVHDVSSSGATVFVEPLEAVEMGNRWREMLAEEQREIARLLRELSARIGARAGEISTALDALADIDLLVARARLGESMKARHLPHDPAEATGDEQVWLTRAQGSLYLRNARHPLIGDSAVPITAWLGSGGPQGEDIPPTVGPDRFTILLITGPNTGGKTVALKTIGLLALMAQAGLCIPADGDSRLPVFDAVYADIGDEQSIEQSLSTFSSHMKNIISILADATGGSLILLDELAAGTDPVEGAALAKAVLSHLRELGALTVATTHHGELKAFAHTTPGVANGSVEFDTESLSPTYRLQIGIPGQSNALAIAERLGMPADVLAEAREGVGTDRLAVESLIGDLHKHREEAVSASETQRAAAAEAERARARVTKELQSLEANRARLIEQTRREMETELQQARAQIREAVKRLEKAERMTVFERAAEVEAAQEAVVKVDETVKRIQRRERSRRRSRPVTVHAGDRVFLHDVATPGEAVTEPDANGDFDVTLGGLRARINLRQVADVQVAAAEAPDAFEYTDDRTLPRPAPELDLRGMTVDEAITLVDQRLDEAARAGVSEIRIIHGKGTGALRQAVREMLRKHPLVSGQAAAEPRAGGDGVTVASIVH